MRANKKIFWISVVSGVVSIGLIILFHWLSIKYAEQRTMYNAIENVFISLVGGAFLSAVTALIGYEQTQKKYTLKFSAEYINVENLIKRLYNFFAWDFDSIKYMNISEIPEEINDQEERLRLHEVNYKENTILIDKFYCILESITNFEYTKFYEILDDYCGLFCNDSKIRKQMQIMMTELSKYNITYSKLLGGYTLYQEKQYNSYAFYKEVLLPMKKQLSKDGIEQLQDEHQVYLNLTKVNDYLKKLYKDKNL